MKILKICGIVAGLHVVAFLAVIFVTPGCSSSTGQTAAAMAPEAPQKPADTVPTLKLPAFPKAANLATDPSIGPLQPIGAADTPAPPAGGTVFFSPTRPGTPAASALVTPPVTDVTPAATYTVRTGDSLWTIAKKNHIKTSDLAAANNLKTSSTLKLGQKLLIPTKPTSASTEAGAGAPPGAGASSPAAPAAAAAVTSPKPGPAKTTGGATKHIVKKNETLGSIAHAYGLKTGDLAAANSISDPSKIRPGQELTIPAGGRASKSGKTSSGSAPAEAPASRPAAESAPAAPPALPPPSPAPDSGAGAVGPSGPAADVPVIKIEPAGPPAPSTPGK